jgi:hypothetical protein
MLTILEINRALDRLGGSAFAPRTRSRRVASRILPERLEDGRRCRIPEHRLMLAVLEGAVAIYEAGCGSRQRSSRSPFRDTAASGA